MTIYTVGAGLITYPYGIIAPTFKKQESLCPDEKMYSKKQ